MPVTVNSLPGTPDMGVGKSCPADALPNRQMSLIAHARASATFKTFELTCLLHGGEDAVRRKREAFDRVEELTGTRDTSKLPRSYGNMNREDAYDEGLEVGKIAFEDGIRYKHQFFDNVTPRYVLANSSPFGMNRLMFDPTIRLLGSETQKSHWLPLSEAGKIVGAYCSTELGHGSFVRGMETTATFDSLTDEFVIHSPTTSSIKFWPGAIGYSCTHAIVTARLIISSVDHGPHFFMVQFRSLVDGTPMPGIRLGDVGLKMSYNATCNGYAKFDHARIPRSEMLMGNAFVTRDGRYFGNRSSPALHGTLLLVRGIIVKAVGMQLAQAVTIAARYSVVREQGMGPNGLETSEVPIIHYKSQHFRILTLIAKAYAVHFASRLCDASYMALRHQQENGHHGSLPFCHSLSAGLKAWSTQTCAEGAEDARKCCGGQGYLIISGLPEIVAAVTATATFEGENYVLWQQVGRYLFKCVDKIKSGQDTDPRMAYLRDGFEEHMTLKNFILGEGPCQARGLELLDPQAQVSIYRHRAVRLVLTAYTAVHTSSKSAANAWNEQMLCIIAAARAHVEYLVVLAFVNGLAQLPESTSPSLRAVLSRLCSLFALSNIISPTSVYAISFVEDGFLTATHLQTIRGLVNDLLEKLLPDIIALTDAWDFTDASLCSALGMYDGNVYENIMRWVNQLPINQRAWKENRGVYEPGWTKWISPVLKANL